MHLRSVGVSYMLAGEKGCDKAEVVEKIGEISSVDELILGGGGTLNWSMVREGLCDGLSLALMSTADGEKHTHSLFEANEEFSTPKPDAFALKGALHDLECVDLALQLPGVEQLEDDSVWLRCDVTGPIEE